MYRCLNGIASLLFVLGSTANAATTVESRIFTLLNNASLANGTTTVTQDLKSPVTMTVCLTAAPNPSGSGNVGTQPKFSIDGVNFGYGVAGGSSVVSLGAGPGETQCATLVVVPHVKFDLMVNTGTEPSLSVTLLLYVTF